MNGVTMSAPEKSESHHVRQTSAYSSGAMTSPSRSDVEPKTALTSVPTAAQATRANTSRHARERRRGCPTSRRSSTAAITTSSVLPTVWPSTVPSGEEKFAASRSAITTPGHSRGP